MGLAGLDYQPIYVPFSSGLRTKQDPRLLDPPGLSICRDAQFESFDALETRFPYLAVGTNILGGGTLANFRRAYECNGELLCFTVDTLYSWDVRDSAWVAKGTHLAVAVSEQTRFATTDDQINADRAELSGTVFYAWSNGTSIYVASLDKATGAVLSPPVQRTSSGTRPRLVAMQTKVALVFDSGGALEIEMLDPANAGSGIITGAVATLVAGGTFNSYYDAVQTPGTDSIVGACRNQTTTAYTAFTATWTGASWNVSTSSKARTCDGPIAVSADPDAAHVQVVRANGSAIQGDLLTLGLVDVFTAQAIGTATEGTPNQIAACHRSVQNGGHYRCYCFWSCNENTANTSGFGIRSNWVDDGNSLGTAGVFMPWCGVGSRAFSYNGSVFVWATFGQTSGLGSGAADTSSSGQFQNAYFLLRDDGFLAAKSVYNRGGGLAPSIGRLPGVQLTDGSTTFRWAAAIRRIVELGAGTTSGAQTQNAGYAERAPQEVTFTFDSNDARRALRLGNTLYIAAGELLQYDGVQLVEVGFHVYPWFFDAVIGSGSLIANALYGYKSTLDWTNAQGEIDRSTTATVANATMVGGPNGFIVETVSSSLTHKTATSPAVRIWRTAGNPTADAPFYLVTNLNPTQTANPNRYLANAPGAIGFNTTVTDNQADATATLNESDPETGATLANLSPPAATMLAASVDRIFLGGIAGQPDTIWYSKQRDAGELAAFNDGLTVDLPPQGGAMSGLAFHPQTQTLIGFRRRAVYQLPGQGFDNLGGGSNFGPAIELSTDVGAVNPDAIAVTPKGILFKSDKGWYLLDAGLNLTYVGGSVAAFDGDTINAVHVVESRHQVRCVTNARVLVYDYLVEEWAEWTIATGVHATRWNGGYVYVDSSSGLMQEQTSYASGVSYGLDVETGWFKPAGPQGRAVVLMLQAFGEFRSSHSLRIRVALDYVQDGSGNVVYIDDVIWPESPAVVGSIEQVRHGPSKKRCQAMKVRITAVAAGAVLPNPSPPTGEALRLTGLALLAAAESGLYSGLPLAQKD